MLLEDHNGARIRSIAHKHNNDADQINTEVLEQWITHKGKQPVTWKTLTQVLHDIELSTLAEEIEAVKCHTGITTELSEDPIQKDLQDIPAEESEQKSTEHMQAGRPEDEIPCKTSDELRVDIDLLAADLLDRYHEKNRNKSTSQAFSGDSSQSLRNITAEVSTESDQGSSGDTPACGIQADKAIQEITDIASELPSRCSELLEAFEQKDKRRVSDSPLFQKSRRDTTVVVTVGSEQEDIPESDFQHNHQQIVDVAADLLSKCFELEALNLEREEDQRSNEGIDDEVDATAYLLNRYFEAGLFSCQASNQALSNSEREESQRHSATGDDPSGINDMTAEGLELRNEETFDTEHTLKQIADVAADLLSRCFELLDFDAPNKESKRNSVREDLRGLVSEQGGIRNEPASCTDSNEDAKCYEALQYIADIAADVLYRCFVLLDFLALQKKQNGVPHEIGDRRLSSQIRRS